MPPSRARLRRITAPAAAAAAVLAVAGCGHIDAALTKQRAIVSFNRTVFVTETMLTQIRQTCSHVPNVQPVPVSTLSRKIGPRFSVRYKIGNASPHDLAALKTCLEQFPEVSGVVIMDTANAGY
jgi:hypothetical protein